MSSLLDLTGQKFGRLTVLSEAPRVEPRRQRAYYCRCDCGTEVAIRLCHLRSGASRSCGCQSRQSNLRHGHSPKDYTLRTPEYDLWVNIRQRCKNTKGRDYRDYGARGISICPEWDLSFEQFLADVGPRPFEGASLDRINNDGHYEPGNVRWATPCQQMNNTRINRLFTWAGQTKTVAEWSRETGIPYHVISSRIRHNWPPERVLTTPVLPKGQKLRYL